MRASEKKAKKNYNQKVEHLRFDIYLNDTDIKEWLDKQISKQGAVKKLIREEIEREKQYSKKEPITAETAREMFKELKAQGMDDNEILGRLYMMFQDDVIDVEELEALCNVLGYEFTEEFINMSPEQQKTDGYVEIDDEELEEEK